MGSQKVCLRELVILSPSPAVILSEAKDLVVQLRMTLGHFLRGYLD